MTTRISNHIAINLANQVVQNASRVEVYDGSVPLEISLTPAGTKLAEISLADPAFSPAVDSDPGGAVSIIGNPGSLALQSGTATYFRLVDADQIPIIDGLCGPTGSGSDMELEDALITQGQSVVITSYTITMPEE